MYVWTCQKASVSGVFVCFFFFRCCFTFQSMMVSGGGKNSEILLSRVECFVVLNASELSIFSSLC